MIACWHAGAGTTDDADHHDDLRDSLYSITTDAITLYRKAAEITRRDCESFARLEQFLQTCHRLDNVLSTWWSVFSLPHGNPLMRYALSSDDVFMRRHHGGRYALRTDPPFMRWKKGPRGKDGPWVSPRKTERNRSFWIHHNLLIKSYKEGVCTAPSYGPRSISGSSWQDYITKGVCRSIELDDVAEEAMEAIAATWYSKATLHPKLIEALRAHYNMALKP